MCSMLTSTVESNWGAEAWRAPDLADGDSVIYDECGRVLGNTCYRSHYFRLVKAEFGGYYLLVKHGGGQERIKLAWSKMIESSLQTLDSDARYFLLHTLYRAHADGKREGAENTAQTYKAAFIQGRLKKRKLRGQDAVKVWIDRPVIVREAR